MGEVALLQPASTEEQVPAPSLAEFTIYCDGGLVSTNPGEAAVAAVVINDVGELIIEQARRIGHATNNEAEYRALLFAINLANLVGARRPHFVVDSQLVEQQVIGWWAINGANLSRLHGLCTGSLMMFPEWSIQHVPRAQNKRADWLVNKLIRPDGDRTLKNPPEAGLEFRTGHIRPGWDNVPVSWVR